jgi:flagellar hook-associated protein 2
MSGGVADGGKLSQGTFSVTIGGTQTNFTIELDGQNNTLELLKNSINSANLGVTASIINDGTSSTPYHLILTSDTAGAANAMTVQHSATPFEVMGSQVTVGAALSFSELQAAQDAAVNFGGQTITRTSNTISDLIDKTTIKLQNAGSGTISFAKNDTSLKEKITGFVAKYNETKLLIAKNTSYDMTTFDPQNKQILPLHGDSTLLGVLSTFNNLVANKVNGLTGTYTSLPSIGITTNKDDGTLAIDSAKLDESIATDHEGVVKIFTTSGSSSSPLISLSDHTRDTSSGTYTVYYTGKDGSGNVQGYFKDSSGNQYTASGVGNFLIGSSGLSSGLTARIDPTATASSTTALGSVTFSVGVAEKISREIYNLNTFDGRFYDKAKNINETITENAKKIKFQEEILTRREEEYKRRFSNLEGVLGSMQGQSQFMSNALGAMPRSGNRYRF